MAKGVWPVRSSSAVIFPLKVYHFMFLEPFLALVAAGTLAVYFGFLTVVNLGTRARALSGPADLLALGFGLSGPFFAGPAILLVPIDALVDKGVYAWVMMAILGVLGVLLIALLRPPRLVVYNISADDARAVMARCAPELDPNATCAGDVWHLPSRQITLGLELSPRQKNGQVISLGKKPIPGEWQTVEKRLLREFRRSAATRNRFGVVFFLIGIGLVAVMIWLGMTVPDKMGTGFDFYFHP